MNGMKLLVQSLMARDFERQVAEIQISAAVSNCCSGITLPVAEVVVHAFLRYGESALHPIYVTKPCGYLNVCACPSSNFLERKTA
jgi:hypothetical protein